LISGANDRPQAVILGFVKIKADGTLILDVENAVDVVEPWN